MARPGSLRLLLFFTCFYFIQAQRRLPSYIKPCHRNDPNINNCIKHAVKQVQPHLAKGIPELTVPSMDPLFLPKVVLNTGQGFNLTFSDIKLKHTNEFIVENVQLDLPRDHLVLKLTFPVINGSCKYDVHGRLLVLQLQGHGPAWVNCTDVRATVAIDFVRQPGKDGNVHLEIDKMKIKADLGRPSLWFEDLFPDPALNRQTNKVLNDNVLDILEDLSPIFEEAAIQLCMGLAKRILERFTYDELFPL